MKILKKWSRIWISKISIFFSLNFFQYKFSIFRSSLLHNSSSSNFLTIFGLKLILESSLLFWGFVICLWFWFVLFSLLFNGFGWSDLFAQINLDFNFCIIMWFLSFWWTIVPFFITFILLKNCVWGQNLFLGESNFCWFLF